MTTTVTLTPNPQVLVTSPTTFELKPTPNTPLYSENPRTGEFPWLYETINPALSIEVVAAGICPPPGPPLPPATPNLITSITLSPGSTPPFGGIGCSIVEGPVGVGDLPEMQLPQFSEPAIQYGSISYPPPGVPVGTLVTPLIGYYSEKYFYDQEYIFSTIYETPGPGKVDKLTLIDFVNGNSTLPYTDTLEALINATNGKITKEIFPPSERQILFSELSNDEQSTVLTSGNNILDALTAEVTAWVKFKPSEIVKMQYNYILTVTHTCPPYITYFTGSMIVNNNWNPVQDRLQYYLNKSQGIIADEE